MTEGADRRHSRALEPELFRDPQAKAEAEARNGLRQYDRGIEVVRQALERGGPFQLRLSLIFSLHRQALAGISSYAGNFRPGGVEIEQSAHRPPGAHLVAELVEGMCDYVNENWNQTAIHLASYVMWRLNWIHPFADGNGRTSRVLSYVVLSIRSGFVLPGYPTIPDLITVSHRARYFAALDHADAALREKNELDLSSMEELLSDLFAQQLLSFHKSVGGKIYT